MARKMKDSGIEWIGEIPKHWTTIKLKNTHDGMNVGESIDKEYWDESDGDIVFYTAGLNPITTTYRQFPPEKYTRCNDLLLARNGTPYVYLPIEKSVYTDHIIRVKIKDGYSKKYIMYCLQRSINAEIVDTVSIATWSASIWNRQCLPLPSYEEQKLIVSFLDSKCAEIDKAIEGTKASIEEYKKLRQAIITEAVTKGLDPDVEMKDSRTGYLGTIPSKWKVKKLRFLGSCQNGISKGAEFFGKKGYPFVSYSDVYKNIILPIPSETIDSTQKERALYSVEKGDIFFTRTSETIEEIGFSSVCLETIPNATFAGFLIRVRPINKELNEKYSSYYFRSDIHRRYFTKEMNLVTRASLGQTLLKNMPILIPSMDEQQRISDYLDTKCDEIDSLIKSKEKIIEELTAYRKSLIYEYVTGKKEVPAV